MKTISYWVIFSNFTSIRHLVQWKCITWVKSVLQIIIQFMKKFNLHSTGRRKCYFFIFVFIFPKFKWLLLKILRKNFLFYNGFLKFLWSSTSSEIFLIYKFLTMKRRPFENFLKFVHSSSIKKPFLNYGLSNMLFCCFFWYSWFFLVLFLRGFRQKLSEKTIVF